ncbi:MAG: hypothetical protein V4473_02020 [Patescibacteria group bacterium]
MNFIVILPYYLRWHYTQALLDIGRLWKNFLIFIYTFFSIPTLLRTLFSPWQRMGDAYVKGEEVGDMFKTFIFNTIMRGVGFVARSIFIIIGVIGIVLGICAGILVYIAWIFLPVVLVKLVLFGISELRI